MLTHSCPHNIKILTWARYIRTFASSAPSSLVPQLMHQFGFSEEVGSLTISVFVAGYCVGPLLWGPLSEQLGRYVISDKA